MTSLNVGYQGFKLGHRVADKLALSLDVKKEADVRVLHKLKNMGHVLENMRLFKAYGLNGGTYVPED